MSRLIALWSGGKDAMLALCLAREQGHQIAALVTFAPPEPTFLAHPLPLIQRQAEALALPHRVITIKAPYEQGYEAALAVLREEWGIEGVVTGDIDRVDGAENWIRERCQPLGLEIHTPLWQQSRDRLLAQLLERGIEARISCVDTRALDPSWVGRTLNTATITELALLTKARGLDLGGEQGEYHSMVTDGPGFGAPLRLDNWRVMRQDQLAYLALGDDKAR